MSIKELTFDQVINISNLVLGLISGTILSSLFWFLTYRSSWRNKLTKEFRVNFLFKRRHTDGNRYTSIETVVELICSTNEQIKILDMYFKIPRSASGTNYQGYPVNGRHYFNHAWEFNDNDEFTMSRSIRVTIREPLIKLINERKINSLRVIVNTNKYGIMKTNKIKIKRI